MSSLSVFVVLAAFVGQLRAGAPLAPPTDGGPPALQPDGSYTQTIKHQAARQEGWASLHSAFHSRNAAVSCPGSKGVSMKVTVHSRHAECEGSSSMPLLKHPWRRRMQCTSMPEGSSCNATLSATGLAVLQLRLQGGTADGSPPQACTIMVRTALAPLLVLRCLLGVWLVLFAHRALATRPGQAALLLCNAAVRAALPWKRQLRAAVAAVAVSAAVLAFIRAHIDESPAEAIQLAAAGELAAFGIMVLAGLAILAIAGLAARAARAARPRPWHGGAFAFAAPFLLQLLGAALIDSNSKELNWAARLAAFFAWLLLLRPRFLSDPAVSGSSLEQHRWDTGAASVTSPAGWRGQAEALQRQLLSGLEEVTSRRRRAKAA